MLWYIQVTIPKFMPSVPRMRLCSSLSVVEHLLKLTQSWFFSGHVSFRRLVCNFSFQPQFRRLKSEQTRPSVHVGTRTGVRAYGCVGVWYFSSVHTCSPLPACLPALGACVPVLGASQPALGASRRGRLPAFGACRPLGACLCLGCLPLP